MVCHTDQMLDPPGKRSGLSSVEEKVIGTIPSVSFQSCDSGRVG